MIVVIIYYDNVVRYCYYFSGGCKNGGSGSNNGSSSSNSNRISIFVSSSSSRGAGGVAVDNLYSHASQKWTERLKAATLHSCEGGPIKLYFLKLPYPCSVLTQLWQSSEHKYFAHSIILDVSYIISHNLLDWFYVFILKLLCVTWLDRKHDVGTY